jgi:hypothetical protein
LFAASWRDAHHVLATPHNDAIAALHQVGFSIAQSRSAVI